MLIYAEADQSSEVTDAATYMLLSIMYIIVGMFVIILSLQIRAPICYYLLYYRYCHLHITLYHVYHSWNGCQNNIIRDPGTFMLLSYMYIKVGMTVITLSLKMVEPTCNPLPCTSIIGWRTVIIL